VPDRRIRRGMRENKDKNGKSKGRGKEKHTKKLYKLERNGKNN
jgi:hypothetical protein